VEVCGEHQQLVTDMAVIKRDLKENTRITQEILASIKGNGGPGLLTETELNKSSINRIWYWVSAISGFILVLSGFAVRTLLVK